MRFGRACMCMLCVCVGKYVCKLFIVLKKRNKTQLIKFEILWCVYFLLLFHAK